MRKERPPEWRPKQPTLDVFESKHPKNHINPMMSVESQFTPEEVRRIHNAAHYTKKTFGDIGSKGGDPLE